MFASENVAHVFTKQLCFEDLKKGLGVSEMQKLSIDDLNIDWFLYSRPLKMKINE